MSDNVVKFTGYTSVDMDADYILEAAKGQMDDCIVLGSFAEDSADDGLYFAGTTGDLERVLTLIKLAEHRILGLLAIEWNESESE